MDPAATESISVCIRNDFLGKVVVQIMDYLKTCNGYQFIDDTGIMLITDWETNDDNQVAVRAAGSISTYNIDGELCTLHIHYKIDDPWDLTGKSLAAISIRVLRPATAAFVVSNLHMSTTAPDELAPHFTLRALQAIFDYKMNATETLLAERLMQCFETHDTTSPKTVHAMRSLLVHAPVSKVGVHANVMAYSLIYGVSVDGTLAMNVSHLVMDNMQRIGVQFANVTGLANMSLFLRAYRR